MGKDWYYWGRSSRNEEKEATAGCMSGMIHLLDFHHLLFTTTSSTRPQQNEHNSPQLEGLEAPRNSLELDETPAANSSTCAVGSEYYYGIPYGVHLASPPNYSSGKKIEKELSLWVEEEKRNSQAGTPRTPNVVARLMGLEVLPDCFSTPTAAASEPISLCHSPIKKTKVTKKQHRAGEPPPPPPRQPLQRRDCNIRFDAAAGSRSLPETPRASSERSRDCHPRLSLQLNKENQHRGVKECESLPLSPSPYCTKNGRRKDGSKIRDENRSPRSRYNAMEIVKQVKESISRRAGSNIVDSHEHMFKYSTAKSSPSRSPPQEFHIPKPPLPPNPIPSVQSIANLEGKEKLGSRKCKKLEGKEKLGSRKCKKPSHDRFNEKIKRHTPPPPPPAATASQSALSFPSLSWAARGKNFPRKEPSHDAYGQPHSSTLATQEQKMYCNGSKEQDPEFLYVRSILECAGITGTAPSRWSSPPLPIDSFTFHQLELDFPLFLLGPIRHRCNRKLLFHLVEEILGGLSGWLLTQQSGKTSKESMLEQLWMQIKGFPMVDCQLIGDIDALVNGDLEEAEVRRLLHHPSVMAEAEKIALEIERDVLDSVLGDVAASLSPKADC